MPTYVVNIKSCLRYDVYCGRGSIWGNPYSHSPRSKAKWIVKSRKEAIRKYREWILQQPDLLKQIPSLKGKILGCYCRPLECHCDILAEMADKC